MLGKAGSEERALTEAIGRLISLALQSEVPLERLCRKLRGISSEHILGFGPNKILSVADAVGIALENHTNGGQDGEHGRPNHVGGERSEGTGRAMQVDGSGLRTA